MYPMQKREIDIRSITADGPSVQFTATPAEKDAIAKRFGLSQLAQFEVTGQFGYDDMITFDGQLTATAERECVVTLKPFMEKTQAELHLLFSEKEEKDDDIYTDIFPIHKGKINLFDVFSEEFGLALNPFPKSVETYLDYHDEDESSDNPFAILKTLKKEAK